MKTFNYKITQQSILEKIAFNKLKKEENILIQIFSSKKNKDLQSILNEISNNLPKALIIGCSSDVQIFNKEIIEDDTLVSISVFEKSYLKISSNNLPSSCNRAGNIINEILTKNSKLLILFDTNYLEAEEFVQGINYYNKQTVVCGAIAQNKHNKSYVIYNKQILEDGAVGISINSDELIIKNEYKFNLSSIGLEHSITKAKDNKVFEISNMKTLDFYEKYLGSNYLENIENHNVFFPLLVKKDHQFRSLKVLKINKDKSFILSRKLKQNEKVKFGVANAQKILSEANISSKNDYSTSESFFIFSSNERKELLQKDCNKENEPYGNITDTSGLFSSFQFVYIDNKTELLSHCFNIITLSENINANKKHHLETNIVLDSNYDKNMETLTHLMEQSSLDYVQQSKNLENEKFNSQMLLTSQKIFLRHAVHETNTPISVIMSNIDLFEIKYGKNAYLSNIEVAMKNIFSIYDDLNYLVKKDMVEYPKRDMDIIDFIRARMEFFEQTALQIGAKFVFSSNVDSLFYNFNETKLQRIIDNNLTNAIKYTNDNSNIYINVLKDEEKFIIDISSSSLYIQSPKKVFKEYYREKSTKEGFGLGLSLVKKICDEENIKINLQSNEYFTSFIYVFILEK